MKQFLLTKRESVGIILKYRGVAKFGIALGSGPRGHGFESRHSDQIRPIILIREVSEWSVLFLNIEFSPNYVIILVRQT